MIMKIFSTYGEHECVPMTLQDITEVLHADEEINSTVTADNKVTRSASDNKDIKSAADNKVTRSASDSC